jgi:hypothetical protein
MNKDDLLKIGFRNNNFLDKYLSLFLEPIPDNSDKHHIIPKSYYKIMKLEINNSKENLRNISYKNHYLAHYYLTKCTTGTLQKAMNYYFTRMNKKIALVAFEINSDIYEQIRINDLKNKRDYISTAAENIANWNKTHSERSDEHRKKMSTSMKKYWKQRKKEENNS